MTNSEPVLAQIIGVGIVLGLPLFLIVTGAQRLRKKRFFGWCYFFVGVIAVIFLVGWFGLYAFAPSDPSLLGLLGIVIFASGISIAITELAYATSGRGRAKESGNDGSTYQERYVIWPKARMGWRAPSLWVSVYDDNDNLLLQSGNIKHKRRDFASFLEKGFAFYGQDGDKQKKLSIEFDSADPSKSVRCDVFDCTRNERLGALSNMLAPEHMISRLPPCESWAISGSDFEIGVFESVYRLMGPEYSYEIQSDLKTVGTIYLRGKNRFAARPIIVEFNPESAPRLDRGIVFSFAALIFAIDLINTPLPGVGGGG